MNLYILGSDGLVEIFSLEAGGLITHHGTFTLRQAWRYVEGGNRAYSIHHVAGWGAAWDHTVEEARFEQDMLSNNWF